MQPDWNQNRSLFDRKVEQAAAPIMVYDKLNFTENWNKKLDCDLFTTFRLHNPNKYRIGFKKTVYFNDKLYWKNVEIYDLVTITLSQMKPWAMMQDTGYVPEEFNKLIRTMYKDTVKDFVNQKWDFIMLKTIEKR